MSFYEYVLFSIISSLVILLGVAYWWVQNKYQYWSRRNVVSIPMLPMIGSYAENLMLKKNQIEIVKDIYDRYNNEKLVGGFKGSAPELIIRDPDIIRKILVKDFNYFHDRNLPIANASMLSQNLFNIDGEKWRLLRQKLTPTFTSSKMKQMFPLIVECGIELQNYIKDLMTDENEIEIKEAMAKFTTDTIGTCAFGLKMNSMADEKSPFRNMGRKIMNMTRWRAFLREVKSVLPFTARLLNYNSKLPQIEKFFLSLIKQTIASRDSTSSRHDFIDLMIELKKKGSLKLDKNEKFVHTTSEDGVVNITDEIITAQAFVFFIAGFETSSTTMSYTLLELALNPEIQRKVRDEIDAVLTKYDNKLTYEAVNDMKYLDMVISETLRMYPPVGNLNRSCVSKYTITETNSVVDKGVSIIIPVYALHRDEKYFPEPEKYSPERFSNDSEITYHPFSYLPFGDGPRNCIGLRFGKLQTLTGLVSILSNYEVKACSRTPTKIEIEPTSPFISCKGGIYLRLQPV